MSVKISVYQGVDYLTVELTGLDDKYPYEGRIANWFIAKEDDDVMEDAGTVTLLPYKSSGGKKTISDLTPGTTYVVNCIITNIVGSSDVPVGNHETSTLVVPVIKSFSVKQAGFYDNKEISCSFNWNNCYLDITTYEIQARKKDTSQWYSKISGVLDSTDITTENFDVSDFGTYEIKFILDTRGYSVEYTSTISVLLQFPQITLGLILAIMQIHLFIFTYALKAIQVTI